MSGTELTEVIGLVEKLNPEQKLRLIEHLAHDLQRKSQLTPRLSWKNAGGLGKEIWERVDVDRYIDDLRNEWDR